MREMITNWKTSVAGLAVMAVTVAFLLKQIDLQQYLAAVGALTGVGLFVAQDTKKQG